LDDKKEARADGGRRFQREGPATKKDLDLVVLVRGTKSPMADKPIVSLEGFSWVGCFSEAEAASGAMIRIHVYCS